MKYKNLIIIGTSHIAKQSVDEVKELIEQEKPEIIALELDHRRLYALLNKNTGTKVGIKNIFKIGIKGYFFVKIGGWAEKKLGKMVGVAPGTEMLTAYELAKQKKIKVFLIDQDIEVTLKRFSKSLSWKEKWNFGIDVMKAFIFRKGQKFDLSKVPSKKIIRGLLEEVKKRYPNVYKVLVKERNYAIAKNLHTIMKQEQEKKIIAIIGAGHEEEVVELIKKHEKNLVEHIHYSYSFSE